MCYVLKYVSYVDRWMGIVGRIVCLLYTISNVHFRSGNLIHYITIE